MPQKEGAKPLELLYLPNYDHQLTRYHQEIVNA